MPEPVHKAKFEIIVKYTCITFIACTLIIAISILLLFWKCTPFIKINDDHLEILNGAISIWTNNEKQYSKNLKLFYKETINKDCSYENIECLAGCVNFVKHLPKSYLLPTEHVYTFTEAMLHKNGNSTHKDSLIQLDRFLEQKEQLDFKGISHNERIKLLATLTTNFGNTCKEAQCVAVDEIKDIHHPLLEETKAIYGLQGQDNLAGPVIFIFARKNDKRFLFYSSIKAEHKILCTSNQSKCNYCEINSDNLNDVFNCQKSNKIDSIVYRRALEMIQNIEIISKLNS